MKKESWLLPNCGLSEQSQKEQEMENCSNCTTPQPDTFYTTGFLAFSIVMLITAVAAIFFNILTAVILSTRKEVFPPSELASRDHVYSSCHGDAEH